MSTVMAPPPEAPATTEVMEQAVPATTKRKYTPLTDAQKQAATLRREAAMVAKYGFVEKAAELNAQADKIAPARTTARRVDPLATLTQDETVKLINHFKTTKAGFSNIAKHISYKRLAAIAAEV